MPTRSIQGKATASFRRGGLVPKFHLGMPIGAKLRFAGGGLPRAGWSACRAARRLHATRSETSPTRHSQVEFGNEFEERGPV